MKRIKKYEVIREDKKELVSEITVDGLGNELHVILYENNKVLSTTKRVFDAAQNVLEEVVEENGLTKTLFEYNEQGKLINEKLFFGDDLYEEVRYIYNDYSKERLVYQEGQMTERMLEEYNEEYVKVSFFDDEGNLLEWNETSTLDNNEEEVRRYDEYGNLFQIELETFDDNGRPIKETITNENGQLLMEKLNWFEGELLVKQSEKKYDFEGYYDVVNTFEYDEEKRLVKFEMRDALGNLLQTQHKEYNTDGDLTQLLIQSAPSGDAVSGIFDIPLPSHYQFEIHKLN